MNLHSITIAPLSAWVWLWPIGGNGQPIARVNQIETSHLYEVQRGAPPPLTPDLWGRNRRQYWSPYSVLPDVLHPLCGRLNTTARKAWLRDYPYYTWRNNQQCQNCQQIARARGIQTAESRRALLASDPWYHMDLVERGEKPDPVTGV